MLSGVQRQSGIRVEQRDKEQKRPLRRRLEPCGDLLVSGGKRTRELADDSKKDQRSSSRTESRRSHRDPGASKAPRSSTGKQVKKSDDPLLRDYLQLRQCPTWLELMRDIASDCSHTQDLPRRPGMKPEVDEKGRRGGWQGKRIEELNKCTEHKQTRELPVQDGSRKEDRSGKLQGSLSSKRTSEGVRVQGSLSQYRAKKEEKGRQSQDSGKSSQPVKSKEFDYNAYYKKVELEKYKNFVNGTCSPSNHIKNHDDHHDHRYARYYKVNGEYKILHKMKYSDVGCLDTGSRPGKKKLLEMQKFRDEVMAAKLSNLYHNHIRIIEKKYVNNRLNEEKDDLSYNMKYCFDHEWYGISYEHGCDLVKNTLERAGKAWLRMHERRIEERLRQMKLEEMKQQPAPEVVDPSTQPGSGNPKRDNSGKSRVRVHEPGRERKR